MVLGAPGVYWKMLFFVQFLHGESNRFQEHPKSMEKELFLISKQLGFSWSTAKFFFVLDEVGLQRITWVAWTGGSRQV